MMQRACFLFRKVLKKLKCQIAIYKKRNRPNFNLKLTKKIRLKTKRKVKNKNLEEKNKI